MSTSPYENEETTAVCTVCRSYFNPQNEGTITMHNGLPFDVNSDGEQTGLCERCQDLEDKIYQEDLED